MADTKISALTALTAADTATTDEIAIVDTSAAQTKKQTVAEARRTFGPVLVAEYTTTGGTSIPFTGIPAGVKRITILIKQLSASGTSNWLVQIGDSGGLETSGYLSSCAQGGGTTDATAGFIINRSTVAAVTYQAKIVLDLENAANFTWISSGLLTGAGEAGSLNAGQKSLNAELDRLSIVPANGSDTFDVVAVSISYE